MPKTRKTPLTRKPAFQRLKKLFKQPGQQDLLWHIKVGESIHKLYSSDSHAYGEGRIQSLAVALSKKENYASKLWSMRSFYEQYDKAEVISLCEPKSSNGYTLTWSHMIILLSLNDDDRLGFQEDCLNAEWSSKELHRRIKGYREPMGKGGRRFRKPKSVEDALRQLIHESRAWHRRYRHVWFSVNDPAIRLVTEAGKSEEIPELAAEAFKILKNIQFDLKDALLRLKDLAAWNRKKSGRRTKKRG